MLLGRVDRTHPDQLARGFKVSKGAYLLMTEFLDITIAGLVMGGIYALAAVGLNLQYGVVRVLNMAYGELIMIGGFLAFWMFTLYGINPLLSLVICIPTLYILGWIVHRLVFQPIRFKAETIGAFEGYSILASYGLIFFIQSLAVLTWGGRIKAYSFLAEPVDIFGATFEANRLVAFAASLVLSLIFYVLLRVTRIGKAVRAIAQDAEVSGLMGINVDSLYGHTFAIGAVLAGMAGVILSTMFPVSATMGFQYTVIAIIVIVLGGLGNVLGSLIGGLLLGIIGAIVLALQPGLVIVAFYFMFLIIILVRPTGILGRQ
jgi:branched-chain amino acid transport system permease protein